MRMRRKTCLLEIEKQIKKRTVGTGNPPGNRGRHADRRLLKILSDASLIPCVRRTFLKSDGPLDLTFLMKVYGLEGFDELRAPKYTPAAGAGDSTGTSNIFDADQKR